MILLSSPGPCEDMNHFALGTPVPHGPETLFAKPSHGQRLREHFRQDKEYFVNAFGEHMPMRFAVVRLFFGLPRGCAFGSSLVETHPKSSQGPRHQSAERATLHWAPRKPVREPIKPTRSVYFENCRPYGNTLWIIVQIEI